MLQEQLFLEQLLPEHNLRPKSHKSGQIFSLAQLKGSLALGLGIVKIMYVSSTLMLATLFWRLALFNTN